MCISINRASEFQNGIFPFACVMCVVFVHVRCQEDSVDRLEVLENITRAESIHSEIR